MSDTVPRPYHSSSLMRTPYPARYVTHRSQTIPLIISNEGSLPSKVSTIFENISQEQSAPMEQDRWIFRRLLIILWNLSNFHFINPNFTPTIQLRSLTYILLIQNLIILHGDQRWPEVADYFSAVMYPCRWTSTWRTRTRASRSLQPEVPRLSWRWIRMWTARSAPTRRRSSSTVENKRRSTQRLNPERHNAHR